MPAPSITPEREPEPIYEEPDEGWSDVGLSFEQRKALAKKRFEERWTAEQGLNPYGSIIGETVHPETVKSYEDLGKEFEDHPYYGPRRAFEELKRNLSYKEKPPKLETTIDSISRLKDEETNKEYLVYSYTESIIDGNGNEHHQNYNYGGIHEIAEGEYKRDIHGRLLETNIRRKKIVYEIPFSKKAVDDILKKNTTNKKPYLNIAHCRTRGSLYSNAVQKGTIYGIKNLEDFKNGSYEDLKALGERALSTEEPSLHRLKDPVLSDPVSSKWRKELPLQRFEFDFAKPKQKRNVR